MSIIIKTPEEIEKMRVACQLAASVLEMIEPFVNVGVSTESLNQRCHDFIVNELGAIPAPLNYHGFPKSICTSVNHVVCHGIPSDTKKLKKGDIINIDITIIKDGYHGDTSKMFFVGEPSVLARRLCRVTYQSLLIAIEQVKPGATFGDIGHAIQQYAQKERFGVVREFCGHGIGKSFHEPPHVLHYGEAGTKETIAPGMIFTIEPMLNAGKAPTKTLNDGWTAVTRDKSLSAQYEHTILVTETGHEILTLRQEEKENRFII
ncbi:type I methionyl aminopeptidase [Ostreibacterium oceani]|uniref:Methionine aminopeptidase n=1 Tax=Ostreibacterium oceani TaxID=2654998 RepID=A0A6N7EUA4_9GAMM|nr:type I methionyl aminopeptidase [Ostreibacterium oceani]MPV85563.1 type I methionyl aminopeptidase [Ostreibacterium oceani]